MKKRISVFLIVALLLTTFFSGNLQIVYADDAAEGAALAAKLIVSIDNDANVVLGKEKTIKVTLSNTDDTKWIYNLNLEADIDSGLKFVNSDITEAGTEFFDDSGENKQRIQWKDVKDLAPGEEYSFNFTVESLSVYRETGTGVNFGDALSIDFTAKGSINPYYYDTENLIKSDSKNINIVPFIVSFPGAGEHLKGAGETSSETDDYGKAKYTYRIIIENNAVYDSKIESMNAEFGNGIQINYNDSEPVSQIPSISDNKFTVSWEDVLLNAGQTKTITLDAAIFGLRTVSDSVYSGAQIVDGTNINSTLSYIGNIDDIDFPGSISDVTDTLNSSVTAKDIKISKSVSPSSGIGYGDTLDYRITIDTNGYYGLDNIFIADTLGGSKGNGQIYSDSYTVSQSVYSYDSFFEDGRQKIVWNIGHMDSRSSAEIDFDTTVDSEWDLLPGNPPIYANDTVTNSVYAVSNPVLSSTPYDSASASSRISTPNINLTLLKLNDTTVTTQSGIEVAVGDKLTYKLDYFAQAVNAKQKNVVINSFIPKGTSYVNSTLEYFKNGNPIGSWGADVLDEFSGDPLTFIAQFDEIDEDVDSYSLIYQIEVQDDEEIVEDKVNYDFAKCSYENTDGDTDSLRDELAIIYNAPVLSMTKSADVTSNLKGSDTVTFTLTIENTGSAPAFDVKLRDVMPDELEGYPDFTDTINITSHIENSNEIVFNIDTINAGETINIQYTADVIDPIGAKRSFDNNASLESYKKTPLGSVYSDQPSDGSVTMNAKNITISKSIIDKSADTPSIGDWIVYKITVDIPDGISIYNSFINDYIPDQQTALAVYEIYNADTDTGTGEVTTQALTGNDIKFDLNDLSSVTKDYYVKTKIDSISGQSEEQTNRSRVVWYDKDSGGSEFYRESQAVLTVKKPLLDASWNKNNIQMKKDDIVEDYIFTLSNDSPNIAYNFTPVIKVPEQFVLTNFSISPSSNVEDAGIRTVTFPLVASLDVGQAYNIEFDAQLTTYEAPQETFTFTGYSGTYYTTSLYDGAQDQVSGTTDVKIPNITVVKTVNTTTNYGSTTEVRPYDQITYNIRITVPEGTKANNIKVIDDIPDSFNPDLKLSKFINYDAHETTVSGDNFNGDIISACQPTVGNAVYDVQIIADVNINGTFLNTSGGNKYVRNTASISWKNDSGNLFSTGLSTADIIVVEPDLDITAFTSDKQIFEVENEEIDFNATIKNNGISTAHSVKIKVDIPTGILIESASDVDSVSPVVSGQSIEWEFTEIDTGISKDFEFTLREDGDLDSASRGDVVFSVMEYYSTSDTVNSKKYPGKNRKITINQPPQVGDYQFTIDEDTTKSSIVVATDMDNDDLTYTKASNSTHGAVTVEIDGNWTYTPNLNYNGQDQFTVEVSDGNGGTDISTITINITPVNDAPTVPNYSKSTPEETPVSGTVVGSDVEGDMLSYSKDTDPAHGSVTVESDGDWTYTPNQDYVGSDQFKVEVTDGNGGTCISIVNITVTPVNDAPTVPNYNETTPEDTPVSGTVSGNDIDGDTLAYAKDTDPAHGSVTVESDGDWTYTPNHDYVGSDQFKVEVSDGNGGTCISTVDITVTPVNDAPTVPNYNETTPEDTPVSGTITGSDVEGDTLSYSKDTDPSHGSVTVENDGNWTYTPNHDYIGSDQFKVEVSDSNGGTAISTVNITVTPVNDAPTVPDYNKTTPEDTPVSGTVSGNDIDGDTLAYTKDTDPAHGSVTVESDGDWTYTPNHDYVGSDQFKVEVSDGSGGTAISTIDITVTPVNDAPTVPDYNKTTPEDTPVSGTVSGNDIDGDTLTYAKDSDPAHGSVTIESDGEWTYTPNHDYVGSDQFKVKVSDGSGGTAISTVDITVTPANDAPTVPDYNKTTPEDTPVSGTVSGNDIDGDTLTYAKDTDPAHGSVTVESDGDWTYTPNHDYVGSDQFKVEVSDGNGGTVISTVDITVTPVNDAPTAPNYNETTPEDTPVSGTIVGYDVDGDTLTYTKFTNTTNGAVTVDSDGDWTYTPNENYVGEDRFTVEVSDGNGETAISTVIITVTPVNDAPTIPDYNESTPEEIPVSGIVTGSDIDGDTLTYSKATDPSHGTVTAAVYGGWYYMPITDYVGLDQFTIEVSDGNGGTAISTITITVTPVNDAPTVPDYVDTTPEETPVSGTIVGYDVDGDILTYAKLTNTTNGAVTVDSDGDWTYTPNEDYIGEDRFTIEVSDGNGETAISTVTITVTPVNDAPTIPDYSKTTPEDTPVGGIVIGTDIDGDALTYAKSTDPANGGVVVESDGNWTYTPGEDFNGQDQFTIKVSDSSSGTAISTITITVTPANDPPTVPDYSKATREETPVSGTVIGNDIDGDTLTYEKESNPVNGEVSVSSNGSWTYTPDESYTGLDIFKVTVDDGNGGTAVSTITITINEVIVPPVIDPLNNAPTVPDYYRTTTESTSVSGTIIGTDEDNDTLEYKMTTAPVNGTLSVSPHGAWIYTPFDGFIGTDTFKVKVSDGRGGAATSTVTIDVINKDYLLLGQITDKETGLPIENAVVSLNDLKGIRLSTYTTGADGQYQFDDLSENIYQIVVEHDLYSLNQRMVNVSDDFAVNGVIREDFQLVNFTIELSADPSSIVGDGHSQTTLTCQIKDKDGLPIPDVLVTFDAPVGTIGDGINKTAVTDANGEASIQYTSIAIVGINPQIVYVTATVNDPVKELFAYDKIQITFDPGRVEGIVIDNGTRTPIEGAIVIVSKDFNEDGITDFIGKQVTKADGLYSIAVPKGNVVYDIEIIQNMTIGNETIEVSSSQTANVGIITGAGDEIFYSEESATGLVALKNTDGNEIKIADEEIQKLKVEIVNIDENGNEFNSGISGNIEEAGVFSADGLEKDKDYRFKIKYEFDTDNDGITDSEIVIGSVDVTVGADGELNISKVLIDPYGVITDAKTGEFIEGADVQLYYADTQRNRDYAGSEPHTPGTLVNLPLLSNFPPANNQNPQQSDISGNFAWMVYPYTDYIVKAEKSGYEYYTSPIISVEEAIVRHNIQLEPVRSNGGGTSGGGPADDNNTPPEIPEQINRDLGILVETDKMRVEEGSIVEYTIIYFNKLPASANGTYVRAIIPDGMSIDDTGNATIVNKDLVWNIGTMSGNSNGTFIFRLRADNINEAENMKSLTALIKSTDDLINEYDDTSQITVMIYSNKYPVEHVRYIAGYEDGTFRPENNITRAEVAAIFARIMDLKNLVDNEMVYSDVPLEHWASKYIEAATKINLFTGYNGKFRPDEPITRAELAVVIARYLEIAKDKDVPPLISHFADTSGHYAEANIEELYRYKIIAGYGNKTFKPNSYITRTETVTMINNMLYRGPLLEIKGFWPDVPLNHWGIGHIEETTKSHIPEYKSNGETVEKYIEDSIW